MVSYSPLFHTASDRKLGTRLDYTHFIILNDCVSPRWSPKSPGSQLLRHLETSLFSYFGSILQCFLLVSSQCIQQVESFLSSLDPQYGACTAKGPVNIGNFWAPWDFGGNNLIGWLANYCVCIGLPDHKNFNCFTHHTLLTYLSHFQFAEAQQATSIA